MANAQSRYEARIIAEATASAAATTAMQTAATAAAQAVVKEFIAGPGLAQVIHATVGSTLEQLGVDTKNPDEMRADLIALRDWRETFQYVRRKGLGTVVVGVISLLMTAMGIGIGIIFSRH